MNETAPKLEHSLWLPSTETLEEATEGFQPVETVGTEVIRYCPGATLNIATHHHGANETANHSPNEWC